MGANRFISADRGEFSLRKLHVIKVTNLSKRYIVTCVFLEYQNTLSVSYLALQRKLLSLCNLSHKHDLDFMTLFVFSSSSSTMRTQDYHGCHIRRHRM
jgi:hypothetical protein